MSILCLFHSSLFISNFNNVLNTFNVIKTFLNLVYESCKSLKVIFNRCLVDFNFTTIMNDEETK